MADHGIADLVQPVHTVQRQSGIDDFIILFMDLRPIYVEYDSQDKDERPIEIVRTAHLDLFYQRLCFL